MGAKSSPRYGTPIALCVIHTNEGDNPLNVFPDHTAENLARYLDRDTTKASYHRIIDDDSVVTYLPDHVASWSLLSGNSRSLGLCFTGWARWSRDEWLTHRGMLRRGADQVRAWCLRYNIPIRKLNPAQVSLDLSGVCGHVDWTVGKRDGTHTDPGPGFPWDVFIAYCIGDDMTHDEFLRLEKMVADCRHELTLRLPNRSKYDTRAAKDKSDTMLGVSLNAWALVDELLVEFREYRAALPALVQREVAAALKSLQTPKG